ncbi:DUF551 domain-containing protein [Escherichia coli]|nr:DUF551 domain-containing protein [Escherichia coli]EKR6908747.1 DUF551 domain-containing protein [Escherichia coli]
MTTITNKKQYPSEQYLNELITNIEFAARAPVEVVRAMAAELQKRREADSAEPVAYIFKHPAGKLFWALTDESNKDQSDVIPVYAAPPVPVVPAALPENDDEDGHDIDYLDPSEAYALGRTAGWNACRAAMLQSGNFRENKNSSTNNFREIAETSTNYPVIPDGLSTVCAEAYQVVGVMADALGVFGDAAVQKVLDNLSQQKLVHRDVLPFSLPVTPDGWISCSELMPDDGQHVIILCDGAFVLYAQYRDGEFFDVVRNGEEFFETQSRNVTDWMPLPEPPQEAK